MRRFFAARFVPATRRAFALNAAVLASATAACFRCSNDSRARRTRSAARARFAAYLLSVLSLGISLPHRSKDDGDCLGLGRLALLGGERVVGPRRGPHRVHVLALEPGAAPHAAALVVTAGDLA